MKNLVVLALPATFLAAPVVVNMDPVFADAPDQGSGKNPSGNKVGPFSGNPHDRPGANAK
jgi:hypothetical protein